MPTGFFASVPAAIAFVDSIARLSVVRALSTDVSARESSSLTTYGPAGTIFVTVAMNEAEASAVFGFFARLSEATTFAEVNVEPSWNLTPLRSWSVSVLVAVAELPARRQIRRDLELGVVLDEGVVDQAERLEVEEVRDDVRVELLHARRVRHDEAGSPLRVRGLHVARRTRLRSIRPSPPRPRRRPPIVTALRPRSRPMLALPVSTLFAQ